MKAAAAAVLEKATTTPMIGWQGQQPCLRLPDLLVLLEERVLGAKEEVSLFDTTRGGVGLGGLLWVFISSPA